MRNAKSNTTGRSAAGYLGSALIAVAASLLLPAMPAGAQIANEASAGGSYNGQAVTSNTSSVSVPLAPARPALAIVVGAAEFETAAGDGGIVGPGDRLVFTVKVTNTGNVTLGGVAPALEVLEFAGQAHDATRLSADPAGAARLAPGEAKDFTLAYTLAPAEAYAAAGIENAVFSRWSAQATAAAAPVEVASVADMQTIAAAPALEISKGFFISTDQGTQGSADVGDLVTYTYVVTNVGNVPLQDVHVVDQHEAGETHASVFDSSSYDGPLGDGEGEWNLTETVPAVFGANADENGEDAIFSTLGVGGAVTFTFVHRVTQAEFDAQ